MLEPGTSVCLDNITLTCYPGYHDEPGTAGWPAGAFLATLPDGLTLYLPGDVRDYSLPLPEGLPPVDFEFGHVWLGRGNALEAEFPMAEACCRFLLQARPGAIFLTHLREVSRDPDSMWMPRHAALLQAHIAEMAPETVVTIPAPGDVVTLSRPFTPDRFAEWPVAEQREFLDNLGVAIRLEVWCPCWRRQSANACVLELAGSLPAGATCPPLRGAGDWRASGDVLCRQNLADILRIPRAARIMLPAPVHRAGDRPRDATRAKLHRGGIRCRSGAYCGAFREGARTADWCGCRHRHREHAHGGTHAYRQPAAIRLHAGGVP